MFSTRLKILRNEKGLTQKELAEKLNVRNTTISKYELKEREPDIKTLSLLSEFFGVSIDYLIGKTNVRYDVMKNSTKKGIKIPVLGKVAAGIPIEAIEFVEDYEEITTEMASTGEYFALKIQGESMEPKFSDGDVVIVRKQNDIESGEIGVVIVNGSDATVKKVVKQENGILLIATNQSVYSPKFYDNKSIETLPVYILGKVVELRAKF